MTFHVYDTVKHKVSNASYIVDCISPEGKVLCVPEGAGLPEEFTPDELDVVSSIVLDLQSLKQDSELLAILAAANDKQKKVNESKKKKSSVQMVMPVIESEEL